MQIRTLNTKFTTTREEGKNPHITGKFITFGEKYQVCKNGYETISPDLQIEGTDIRALVNHDTTLVLGRTIADTFKVEKRADGIYGDIEINPNDSDAMNCKARVDRGDVNQCSFGFDILDEETETLGDGSVLWTIKAIKLFEMSVCTFPAYETTHVEARSKDLEKIKNRELEVIKVKMRTKLKGDIDA